MWLSTSIGNVVLLYELNHQPPAGATDYNGYDDVGVLADLANLQILKLTNLG
jgi:hypothetical protein